MWRGSLLPLGCAAVVNQDKSDLPEGSPKACFAGQRERAPSPQDRLPSLTLSYKSPRRFRLYSGSARIVAFCCFRVPVP